MWTEDTVANVRIGTRPSLESGEFTDRLSRSDLFEVLSNERRRCALYYLQQQEGEVELGDVVDYVTAWQYDKAISELNSQERMCVYSALHQAHLPKLDSAGFVEYDSENGRITIRDELEYARLYLEYDPGNDIAWSTLYLGLVGIGLMLASTSQLGIAPFDWVGGSILVWMLLLLFSVAAVAHAVHEWRNKLAAEELFDIDR